MSSGAWFVATKRERVVPHYFVGFLPMMLDLGKSLPVPTRVKRLPFGFLIR